MQVLIVEDDRNLRERLARALRERGHTVATASCGAEARRLIAESFEAAVVDLHLGDELALDVLPHLLMVVPRLRVVLSSGRWTPEDLRRANTFGVVACLLKPFDVDELVAAIAENGPASSAPS